MHTPSPSPSRNGVSPLRENMNQFGSHNEIMLDSFPHTPDSTNSSFKHRVPEAPASAGAHSFRKYLTDSYNGSPWSERMPRLSPSTPASASPYQTARSPPTPWSSGYPTTPSTPDDPFFSQSYGISLSQESKRCKGDPSFGHHVAETATAESLGRYLMISKIPTDTKPSELQAALNSIGSHKALVVSQLRTRGIAFVVFHDTRHTIQVFRTLQNHSFALKEGKPYVLLQCKKVDRARVEEEVGVRGTEQATPFAESIIVLEVGSPRGIEYANVKEVLGQIGDVMWTQEQTHGKKFVAEFYDTRHAQKAIDWLDNKTFDDARLFVYHQCKDPFSVVQGHVGDRKATDTFGFTLGSAAYQLGAFGGVDTEDKSTDVFSHGLYTPPHSRSAASAPNVSSWEKSAMGMTRSLSSPAHSRSSLAEPRPAQVTSTWDPKERQRIPEENRVVPERILSGHDKRTTVMIKDVPNKLSRKELVDILNEVVPGDFDFVYLRFDFTNCCNVGYAFVNFTTVDSLYRFVQAKVGKKWNLFSSEKVLQVSYANIQGKVALVNKFKNSAVMHVIEPWRPQIFYSSGSMKGLPEPFPDIGPRHSASLSQLQTDHKRDSRLSTLSNPCPREPFDYHYSASTLGNAF